jgi:hypothetical protein
MTEYKNSLSHFTLIIRQIEKDLRKKAKVSLGDSYSSETIWARFNLYCYLTYRDGKINYYTKKTRPTDYVMFVEAYKEETESNWINSALGWSSLLLAILTFCELSIPPEFDPHMIGTYTGTITGLILIPVFLAYIKSER